ncbi:peptidylprolyl isomerase [Corynebacterium epidermidicanis]|uniref:Peptidyl-prolyl cis-trans isomerase (Rotamase)-cyclophilin family n=1 Tax=Corynebacterium epidermidicanis TaxID=1050174 RepID=A0A0G3GWR2_9CORY|nr:peptidylprolyl isomerase [Corynebacterium epidermidicanis]AKK03267.1 peptidyl-prolyl cis-trans isomerase (rotamase) - cyclophilin family [Corynebacterium epidermidicanis]
MSSNKERRQEAMRALDRELKSRDRAEKAKPLGVVAMAAVVILALVGGIWFAATRTNEPDAPQAQSTEASSTKAPEVKPLAMKRTTALPETVSCEYQDAGTAAKAVTKPTKTEGVSTTGEVKVSLDTTAGPIDLTLDRSASPCTVNAIEHLAYNGYYDNTVCHRITTQGIYVLQCGDPSGTGSGGPGFQFKNEYPTDEMGGTSQVVYPRGSIAMANAGADTNGSQFFLNYQDSPLAANYTYFGKISDAGLATLDKVAAAGTKNGGGDGAPATEVKINSAKLG